MLAGLQMVPIRVLMHKDWLRSEMRVSINQKKVEQYAREKAAGHRFPSPVAFVDSEEMYWLGDGFHRVQADSENGREEVEVFVRPGAFKDAVLWNLKANRESQGLPFAQGDFTKAAKVLLTEPCFGRMSDKQIADIIGCSKIIVGRAARALGRPPRKRIGKRGSVTDDEAERAIQMRGNGASLRKIAEVLGRDFHTVKGVVAGRFQRCPHCNGTGKVPGEAAAPAQQ